MIVNWDWDGHVEQGLTQKQLPGGAASSASTSEHNEQQVCEHGYQSVNCMVYGLG